MEQRVENSVVSVLANGRRVEGLSLLFEGCSFSTLQKYALFAE